MDSDETGNDSEVEDERFRAKPCVIVEEGKLMERFKKCQRMDCNAAIDPDEIQIFKRGAYWHVKATCNNSHTEDWESCATVGQGRKKYAVVNILMVFASIINLF